MRFIKSLLLLIFIYSIVSCGHIKKEYEIRQKIQIDTCVKTVLPVLDTTVTEHVLTDKYIPQRNEVIIIIGSFRVYDNAKKLQKEIDNKEIFTSIKQIDGYYRVIMDTLDLNSPRDSLKLINIKRKLDVYPYKRYNK